MSETVPGQAETRLNEQSSSGDSESFASSSELSPLAEPDSIGTAEPWPMVQADRDLLERLMAEAGVDTSPTLPGLGDYWRDLVGAAVARLTSWLEQLAPGVVDLLAALRHPLWRWLLGLGIVLLTAILVWRWIQGRQRPTIVPVSARMTAEQGPDPAQQDWQGELEARLQRGAAAEALEALWWWLAVRLRGNQVEPSWTSRELVLAADRGDLLPGVASLDRMLYGGDLPKVTEVRTLWRQLAARVASGRAGAEPAESPGNTTADGSEEVS